MKHIFNLTLALLCPFFLLPGLSLGQCSCDALPAPTGIIDTVSTVSELQAAFSAANVNNGNYTILLENGTYSLTSELLYIGSNMEHFTIRSLSGIRDSVIIEGEGMNGGVLYIFNVAADHFTVADITLGWVGYHGVQIHGESDTDSCLIHNVKFVDINEQMIKVSGNPSTGNYSDGGKVECCWFEFTSGVANQFYTGGIDAHVSKDWIVRDNVFKHIRSPDATLAEHAIHFWRDCYRTLVERNVIINCDRGIGFGLGNTAGNGHFEGTIRNNFVHTSRDVGIGLERARNIKVFNNTVHTESYFNSIEYRFDSTYNAYMANNLVNEAIASRNGGTGNDTNNFDFSSVGVGIFVNAAGYDYHLGSATPGVADAGIVLPDMIDDIECAVRPFGIATDIGADEYVDPLDTDAEITPAATFSIFPNPNQGDFKVEATHQGIFQLIGMDGKKHWEGNLAKGLNEVHLPGLPNGIYAVTSQSRGHSSMILYIQH